MKWKKRAGCQFKRIDYAIWESLIYLDEAPFRENTCYAYVIENHYLPLGVFVVYTTLR